MQDRTDSRPYLGIETGGTGVAFALIDPIGAVYRAGVEPIEGNVLAASQLVLGSLEGIVIHGMGLTGSQRCYVKTLLAPDLYVDVETAHRALQDARRPANNPILPSDSNIPTGAAIGAALLCMNRNIRNCRQVPQITAFRYLGEDTCLECPNRCEADVIRIKMGDKHMTLGKNCES